MAFTLDAACGCQTGKLRSNNEDNFYFADGWLAVDNTGLDDPAVMNAPLYKPLCLAVFDGMGGENFGEEAAYAAASEMRFVRRGLRERLMRDGSFLTEMCARLNAAVVRRARELKTERMGCTLAAVWFEPQRFMACNLGDSRIYLLRDGKLERLSKDHVEKLNGPSRRKAPLTQYLGLNPEEYRLDPSMAFGKLRQGDRFLICSDGLTDMLSEEEIAAALSGARNALNGVHRLIGEALEHGGRDNVTAVVGLII